MAKNHVQLSLFLSLTILSLCRGQGPQFGSPVLAQPNRNPFSFPGAGQTSPGVPYTFPQMQTQTFPMSGGFPNMQQPLAGTGSQVPSVPGSSQQNTLFSAMSRQFPMQFGQNPFAPQQSMPNPGQNPFVNLLRPPQFPTQVTNPMQPAGQSGFPTQSRLPFPNQGQTQFPNMVRPMFPNQQQPGFQTQPQFPNQMRPQFPNQQPNPFLNQVRPQLPSQVPTQFPGQGQMQFPSQGQFPNMIRPQMPNQGQPTFPNTFPQVPSQGQGQLPNQMRPTFPNQVAPMPQVPGTSQSQGQNPLFRPTFPISRPNVPMPQQPTNQGQVPNQIGQPQPPSNPQEGPRELAAKEAKDLILRDRNLARQVKNAVSTKTRDPSFMMCPLVVNPNLPPPNLNNDILVQACLTPRSCQTLNQERAALCSSQPNTCAYTLRLVQLCPLLRLPPGPQGRNAGSRPAPPGAPSGTTQRPLDIMLQRLINALRANGGRLPGFPTPSTPPTVSQTPGSSPSSPSQPPTQQPSVSVTTPSQPTLSTSPTVSTASTATASTATTPTTSVTTSTAATTSTI